MDLSFSMKDDLENVKNLGTDLMREMQGITSDFRIGEEKLNSHISRDVVKHYCNVQQNVFFSRFWLIRGEDSHALHQHHAGQTPQPLHREPELHQPLQL